MAAFIDEDLNIPISTHVSSMLPLRMLGNLLYIPNSFARNGRSSSCADGSCASCFEVLFLEFSPHKSPCGSRVGRFLLITPFSRNLNFEHFPVASPAHVTLSFIVVPRIDRDVPGLAEIFPSRSTGCVTPSWQMSPSLEPWVLALPSEVASWPLFDMALCFSIGSERNFGNGCERTSRNSSCWTNEADDSTRHAKNYLCLEYQQIGFGCQHIWFGSWVPI